MDANWESDDDITIVNMKIQKQQLNLKLIQLIEKLPTWFTKLAGSFLPGGVS